MTDKVDQIADVLVDDHVALLKENARLRDLVSRARYHLYLLADEDDDELMGLVEEMTTALARGKHDDYSVALEAMDEIDRLQQVCRRVYEVWAGSEGIPMPETAAEAYLLSLVEAMRDEAKEGLKNA